MANAMVGSTMPPLPEQELDGVDASMIEQIADAVIRKIDEREKINLLADAVLHRLHELHTISLATEVNQPQFNGRPPGSQP